MKKILNILITITFSSSLAPNFNNNSQNYNIKNSQELSITSVTAQPDIIQITNNNSKYEKAKKYLNVVFKGNNELIVKLQKELANIIHEDSDGYFIYENDAAMVVSLDLSSANISNFKGLNIFTNLKSLNIANNGFSKEKPINLLDLKMIWDKIEILDISKNYVNDINDLMFIYNLKELNASYMKMFNKFWWNDLFLSLANFENFTKLNLCGNRIGKEANINGLSLLQKLNNLNLSYNEIENISMLDKLKNLSELNLNWNNITNFSYLNKLVKLKSLKISGNYNPGISDISPLSNLENLVELELISIRISDISPLSNLENLIELNLSQNNISDISPLSNLRNLTRLLLSVNNISDISPLSNLENLVELELVQNDVSNLTPLENLKKLSELFLHTNRISNDNWWPIHNLPNYKTYWDNEVVRNSQKKLE